jgi:cobalt-zinc-cadmium efflux system outer membrane protein
MRKALGFGLVALAAAWPARGQEISETSFLSVLSDGNAALRALEEPLARAEAARKRAGALSNPRAEFWQERPADNPRVSNWTLAWTPPLDGRLSLSKRAADASLEAAKERLAADTARLRAELRRAFANWSLAAEREAIARQQLERLRPLAEREQERASAGEAARLSARRLALAESDARVAAAEAEADRVRAEATARAWRPDLAKEARPARVELPDITPPAGAVSTPELRALEREAEQAGLQQRLAGRYWGFPELQVGWQRLAHGGLVQSGPILAASWSVPVLDRNQAARAEAARLTDIAQARVSLMAARVRAEIDGRRAEYLALADAARDTERTSTDADRVIAASEAAFRAGEATLTDLLEALRATAEARLRTLELRGRALEVHRELEAALGRPLTH